MLHPLMTAELVRQRRAALAAESRNQRLVRPLRRARADPRARPATYDGTDIGVPRLPAGTWTIDPAHSSVSFAWRTLWRWTMTGRLQALGVINLDELPVVGVIRSHQACRS
jgi:polyisoprenoid-binding protein YceI